MSRSFVGNKIPLIDGPISPGQFSVAVHQVVGPRSLVFGKLARIASGEDECAATVTSAVDKLASVSFSVSSRKHSESVDDVSPEFAGVRVAVLEGERSSRHLAVDACSDKFQTLVSLGKDA